MQIRRLLLSCSILFLAACEEERLIAPPMMPVRTEIVKRTPFTASMTLLGTVRPANTIPLTAVQRGTIVYPARFAGGLQTGAEVRRGELLAEVRNDQLLSSRTQMRLQMEVADADFDRAKRSHEQGVISPAEYSSYRVKAQLAREAWNASTREVGTLRLVAPAAGRLVVTKTFPAGMTVEGGTVIAEVASEGAPVVESAVAASERDRLRPGLPVRFSGGASGQWNGAGHISELATVIDASGTARVVATIDSLAVPPAGTGVELYVELDRLNEAVSVPEDAIVAGADGPAVFVMSTSEGFGGRFRVKRVQIEAGGRSDGRVEVRSGLRDGDRVVVTGADALAEDALVVETESKS
jgi:RND family efflux transporter MFP subunit